VLNPLILLKLAFRWQCLCASQRLSELWSTHPHNAPLTDAEHCRIIGMLSLVLEITSAIEIVFTPISTDKVTETWSARSSLSCEKKLKRLPPY
jgi:hypothetical protein